MLRSLFLSGAWSIYLFHLDSADTKGYIEIDRAV